MLRPLTFADWKRMMAMLRVLFDGGTDEEAIEAAQGAPETVVTPSSSPAPPARDIGSTRIEGSS